MDQLLFVIIIMSECTVDGWNGSISKYLKLGVFLARFVLCKYLLSLAFSHSVNAKFTCCLGKFSANCPKFTKICIFHSYCVHMF